MMRIGIKRFMSCKLCKFREYKPYNIDVCKYHNIDVYKSRNDEKLCGIEAKNFEFDKLFVTDNLKKEEEEKDNSDIETCVGIIILLSSLLTIIADKKY
jgi:hypothetical protein